MRNPHYKLIVDDVMAGRGIDEIEIAYYNPRSYIENLIANDYLEGTDR